MQSVQKDMERKNRLLSHHNLQPLVLLLKAIIVGSFQDNLYLQIFVDFLSSFPFTHIIVYYNKKAKCKSIYVYLSRLYTVTMLVFYVS